MQAALDGTVHCLAAPPQLHGVTHAAPPWYCGTHVGPRPGCATALHQRGASLPPRALSPHTHTQERHTCVLLYDIGLPPPLPLPTCRVPGFPYAFMSGFCTSAARLGAPDTGLISYYEMMDQVGGAYGGGGGACMCAWAWVWVHVSVYM